MTQCQKLKLKNHCLTYSKNKIMKKILLLTFSILMICGSVYAKRFVSRAESGESVSRTVISNVAVPVKQNKETANTPTSVVAKQNPRQEYAYLYSKSDFEKAKALSDEEFTKDVNLRKDHKARADRFIKKVKGTFAGDDLMSAKSSLDERVITFIQMYDLFKDNIYISDIKHQLISSNSKMIRDYAKYSSLYSSESEFVDAYLSKDFKADVKERKQSQIQ